MKKITVFRELYFFGYFLREKSISHLLAPLSCIYSCLGWANPRTRSSVLGSDVGGRNPAVDLSLLLQAPTLAGSWGQEQNSELNLGTLIGHRCPLLEYLPFFFPPLFNETGEFLCYLRSRERKNSLACWFIPHMPAVAPYDWQGPSYSSLTNASPRSCIRRKLESELEPGLELMSST